MLRRDVNELVGCTLREFTHPDDVRAAQPHRARLELGIVDSFRIDQRYRRRDGEYVWARTRVSAAEDDGVMLAITHIEDVTEQRRAAEQLRYAARHDELTGLPNRSYLMHILHDRLATAEIGEVAVLFVDLDHFKTINDSLGHEVGDQLLQSVAGRLRSALRDHDVLARFGGDEFVVVMQGEPIDVAERLRKAIHPPVVIGEHELFITASIGYSTNHEAGMSPNDLIRDADAAMYRAKARGRDCVEAFEVGGFETGVQALRTSGELRRGIERGEVVPYFQPIVDLASGRVIGYEVLSRWLHPDRGLLPPNDFLPLAEETGLLIELGHADAARLAVAAGPVACGRPPVRRTASCRSTWAPASWSTRTSPRSSSTRSPRRASTPTRCGSRSPRRRCCPTSSRPRSRCASCAASGCTCRSTTSAPATRRSRT